VPQGSSDGGDELHLLDGTVLRGTVEPADGRLKLAHAELGALEVPAAAVRAVVRRSGAVAYLADLPPAAVEAAPLLRLAPKPAWLARPWDAEPRPAPARWLNGLRLEPKTLLRVRLPKLDGPRAVFRAVLGPDEDSAGAVRLRLRVRDAVVFDQTCSPADGWKPVSVDLPSADELAIEVDFVAPVRFPCRLVLGDPHVVALR
jgi:hypothetical protein